MTTKKWLTVVMAMIVLGTVLIAFSSCSSDSKVSFFISQYENKVYEVSNDFEDIVIEVDTADVYFLVSEVDKCHVVAYTQEKINYDVKVEDGALKISVSDDRAWYENIKIGLEESSLCIYLPKSEYKALTLNGSTCDVNLSQNFKFTSIDMDISTGDLNLSASSWGAVKLETTTGDIKLSNMSAESVSLTITTGDIELENVVCSGDVSFKGRTGECKLKNVSCNNLYDEGTTGDVEMENVIASGDITIVRSTGKVSLYACDATELYIETTTGDVKGVLLTPKIFIVRTTTGDIDVPETTTGGTCKIKTTTGDVIFTIAE